MACVYMHIWCMLIFTAALFFTKTGNFGRSTGLSRGKKLRMVKKWRQSYEKHVNFKKLTLVLVGRKLRDFVVVNTDREVYRSAFVKDAREQLNIKDKNRTINPFCYSRATLEDYVQCQSLEQPWG